VTASIQAADETSGLERSTLEAMCDGRRRASTTRPAAVTDLLVELDRSGCTVTGSAADAVGHTTSRKLSPQVSLIDLRTGSQRATFSGAWKTVRHDAALARTLLRTSTGGAQVRLAFQGAQVAIVARRGPSGGRLDVIVDGQKLDSIDLYAPSTDERRIVHVASVPRDSHVLKLRTSGTANERSSGTMVWLDAVLVLDRRK
jgi:hypothetical protein